MSDVGLEMDSCNELSVDALLETVFEEALMTRLPPPSSGFPFALRKAERFRLRRSSRQNVRELDGKPEPFRTGSGNAA